MEKNIPEAFLKKLASHLHGMQRGDLSDVTVVLPNKRSAVFLSYYLSQGHDKPIWSPQMCSIEQFVFDISGFAKADPSVLLLALYHAYREVMESTAEPFVSFLPWGQVLLDDFNELDANLVSIDDLFSYLSEAKAIELWNPGANSLSESQEAYLNFYRSLGILYERYTSLLSARGIAYPGMAARAAWDSVSKNKTLRSHGTLVFAGLNALSEAERKIIQHFRHDSGTQCLWDTDRYYMDDPQQEAGLFLRKHRDDGKNEFEWVEDYLLTGPLQINIIGVPGRVGQVKQAAAKLHEWSAKDIPMDQRVAVVLSDEGLLLSMLNSIPEAVADINVTMGLPLRQTAGFSFMDAWLDNLSEAAERLAGSDEAKQSHRVVYRIHGVINLLKHPWMFHLLPPDDESQQALRKKLVDQVAKQGIIYISPKSLHMLLNQAHIPDEIASLLFPSVATTAEDLPGLGRKLIRILHQGLGGAKVPAAFKMEEETLYAFDNMLGYLEELWKEFNVSDDVKAFRKVFERICRAKQLSFSGEPLKGLQIMGLLETRSLDFERIILLSANEDLLPSGKQVNSFIPNDIRHQFGLPNQHYRASVFAYHFYRLLQRSKEVICLYNTEPGEIGGGEMSRFLSQLMVELKQKNPNAVLTHTTSGLFPHHQQSPPINIPKDQEVMDALKQMATKGFSASSLNLYRQCPLRFYLNYLAHIEEPLEETEELDNSDLGDLVHVTLKRLYHNALYKELTPKLLHEWQGFVGQAISQSFQELFSGVDRQLGKNLLLFELATAYVRNMLSQEARWIQDGDSSQRIVIKDLEVNGHRIIHIPGLDYPINLNGQADRIDSLDGGIRIIDYKTGKVVESDLNIKGMTDFVEGKKQIGFQLLFYAYLFYDSNIHPLSLAIFKLRSLSEGPNYLRYNEDSQLSPEVLLEFETFLMDLISEIFDTAQPFVQTEDEDNCKYCPYQLICNRVPYKKF